MVAEAAAPPLEFPAEFYKLDAIEAAAGAFSHCLKVRVETRGVRHCVHLEALGATELRIARLDFANWVLAASVTASETRPARRASPG